MSYRIFTDTTADLTKEIIEKYGIEVIPLSYFINGKEFEPLPGDNNGLKEFYDLMREKKHEFQTSMANGEKERSRFEEVLANGEDIIYIGFSSGLSGTFDAVSGVLRELNILYPERKVYAVDTLAASMGEGLIVLNCAKLQADGASIETVRDWAEGYKQKVCHWFTVDDLDYLRRGGRISKTVAIIGSVLQIKPVLHVDDAGRLISVGRANGRKNSIEKLVSKMGETGVEIEKQTVMISHGDCEKEAEYAAALIKERYGVKDIIINCIGATIGCHSGPGTLAVFFLGTKR